MKRPTHGTIAGYLALMMGVVALTGGGAYAASTFDGKMIKAGSIKTSKMAKNSVTSVKIKKGAVTSVKLARNAVKTASVKNRAITGNKIGVGAITSTHIKRGSLEARDFSSSALTTIQGTPGTGAVTTPTLADGAVTASKLADGSVTGAKLADGAVSGTKVPLQIVTVDGVVTPASLASATAPCPAGTRAFGGGVTLDDSSTVGINTTVRQSQPVADAAGAPVAWSGTVVQLVTLGTATPFHVYAVCG